MYRRTTIVLVCPCRYHHDSSETVGDAIELIATDGINAINFVLEVKVL